MKDFRNEHIREAWAKYSAYDERIWTKEYFDEFSGGFNVYHKKHQFATTDGGGDAEKTVGILLAKKNAKQVEFLPEGGEMAADLWFDCQTWEIKYINNANVKTIRWYIENIRAKKAKNGIFYWDKTEKIECLRAAVASEAGKLKKMGRIDEMPDIYYMDNEGLLKLLWKK